MFRFNMTSLHQLLSSRWIAALVLFSALQTTLLLWMNERQHAEALQAVKFKQSVLVASEAIQQRLNAYRQILKGVEQLYISSQFVSAEEFRRYVEDFTKSTEYNSLNALGFIKYIHLHHPETFKDLEMPVQQLLKQLEFIKGDDEIAPVLYVEPRNDVNHEALLKNTFLDAQLRADLLEAGDGNRLVLSRHSSVSNGLQPYKNYIFNAPVYRGTAETPSVGDRRRHLNGWVFLRFDVTTLLAEALHATEQRLVHFDVFDMSQLEGQVPLYHSGSGEDAHVHDGEPAWSMMHTLNVSGQVWRLQARSSV